MIRKETLKNYKYYNGEAENPYEGIDFGKAFWWTVESYAFTYRDKKEQDKLSSTMIRYLKEHMWEGDGQPDTAEKEMLVRAHELYINGIWSRDYICCKHYTFQQAVEYSMRN